MTLAVRHYLELLKFIWINRVSEKKELFVGSDGKAKAQRFLEKHNLKTSMLKVELTESALVEDETGTRNVLNAMQETGLKISLDDFGTGYSSLAYLRRFPLDALKIDRTFIDELVVDADDTAITLAIISMAKSLRLEVIAEGVETAQQQDFLAQNECDDIQGYYFSRPLVFDDFIAFLKSDNSHQQDVNQSVS